jgi:hypothetical protein
MNPTFVTLSPDGDIVNVGGYNAALTTGRSLGPVIAEPLNDGHSFTRNPEPSPSAARGLAASGLRAFSKKEVLSMSLREAHERIKPFFYKMRINQVPPKSVRERLGLPETTGKVVRLGNDVDQYQDAQELAENWLTENYKTEKRIEGMDKTVVMGLAILPHAAIFEILKFPGFAEYHDDVRNLKKHLPKGFTFCVGSSQMCRDACLAYSGRNVVEWNVKVKLAKTLALLYEPVAFLRFLWESCKKVERSGAAFHFIRLNVLSDIPWELVCPWLVRDIDVNFYDYTKVSGRDVSSFGFRGKTPEGRKMRKYDLTFSFSGKNENLCRKELAAGNRVAAVFIGMKPKGKKDWIAFKARGVEYMKKVPLPPYFWSLPVVDGDKSDLRALDPADCIVALRFKTPAGRGLGIHEVATDGFSFVTPVYVVKDHAYLEEPVTRNPAQVVELEYLMAAQTPRAIGNAVDEE